MDAGAQLPQLLLIGIVLPSVVGALLICLVVLKYGFPFAPVATETTIPHRAIAIRFTHAVAAGCFAIAATLAVLLLAASVTGGLLPTLAATLRLDSRAASLESRLGQLPQRLDELTRRLEAIEAASAGGRAETQKHAMATDKRLSVAENRLTALGAPERVADLERRPAGLEKGRGTAESRIAALEASMLRVSSDAANQSLAVQRRLGPIERRMATLDQAALESKIAGMQSVVDRAAADLREMLTRVRQLEAARGPATSGSLRETPIPGHE